MKPGPLIGILLAIVAGPLAAQEPSLTVRDGRGNPLRLNLEELDFEVRFLGDVAETSITLGFRNESDRLAEGEFVMPLPEGATVSEYALEVEGAMREAVAVEKERARFAYEAIKAQRIDPGIVEREAGNVYRTRIFPIPRNGIKRVRIGYVEHLRRDGAELHYELPFQHEDAIAHVTGRLVHLEATPFRLTGVEGLGFVADGKAAWMLKANDAKVSSRPGARWPAPEEASVHLEKADRGGAWFYLSDWFPEGLAPLPSASPASFLLVWDASESGLQRDHEREFALLDAYFKQAGKTRVRLQVLRNESHFGGDFAIEGGDWSALRKVLENTFYDGAAGFEQLVLDRIDQELVLFFTDGISPHSALPPASKPLYLIDASPSFTPAEVRAVARQSGGEYLDLLRLGAEGTLPRLTTTQPGVMSVQGDFEGGLRIETSGVAGDPVRIFGRLAPTGLEGDLRIVYGVPGGGTVTHSVPLRRALTKVGIGLVQRLWAQHALVALEQEASGKESEIIAHCKRYGLVSDHTSLIVLERFSDHVRYEIPPPEPELVERYEEEIRRKREEDHGWRRLVWQWKARKEWHQREFPWADVALLPRLRQVSIWVGAIQKTFAKEEIDQETFGVIDGWRRRALATTERKGAIRGGADYTAWFKEVVDLVESGKGLKATAVTGREGSPVVVSVRGLVKGPGKVSGEAGLSLAQAIERAGGVHALGNKAEVELYRNAGKTIYNLLSKEYEDVPLRPGDMIVVRDAFRSDEEDWGDGFGGGAGDVDPFGEESPPPDPGQGPAVLSDEDVWIPMRGDEGAAEAIDPFAGLGGAPALPLRGEIRIAADRGAGAGAADLVTFEEALEAGTMAEEAYAALKGRGTRAVDFYVGVARILFAKGHPVLGRQVLSNLLETSQLRLDRLLAAAMWLEEFGQDEIAADLLRRGLNLAPDLAMVQYHLARLAMKAEQYQQAGRHLSDLVRADRHAQTFAALIALTDLTALDARQELTESPVQLRRGQGMPPELNGVIDADLRVVITTNQPDYAPDLSVEEPSGHTCHDRSPCGGQIIATKGVSEYMMRRALPGKYTIKCQSSVALTVHLTLYQNWGRAGQTSKDVTVALGGGGGAETLADYEFTFPE